MRRARRPERALRASLVLCAAFAIPRAAGAELQSLDVDDPQGVAIAGGVTRDTETGLDWLDLTLTSGVSYDEMVAGGGGWLGDGWRHASAAELCAFLAAYASYASPCPSLFATAISIDSLSGLFALIGVTLAPATAQGIYDDGTPGDGSVGRASMQLSGGSSIFSVRNDGMASALGDRSTGHFLVRSDGPLPDLAPELDRLTRSICIETQNFPDAPRFPGDPQYCDVEEGLVGGPGDRRLILFATETMNLGAADLELGDPLGNALFEQSSETCHNHPHFREYIDYRLIGPGGEAAVTRKFGFCLLDSIPIPGFPFPGGVVPPRRYGCAFQGIQSGYSDVYQRGLSGQWLDITGVAPGTYTLEVEVNPDRVIAESDYGNNTISVEVDISAADGCLGVPTDPPPNDFCVEAVDVFFGPEGTFSDSVDTRSATQSPIDPASLCGGGGRGPTVWYRYAAPAAATGTLSVTTAGSNYDTVLSAWDATIGCGALSEELACNDDISKGNLQSTVALDVAAGDAVLIQVGAYADDPTGGQLEIAFTPEPGPGPSALVAAALVMALRARRPKGRLYRQRGRELWR